MILPTQSTNGNIGGKILLSSQNDWWEYTLLGTILTLNIIVVVTSTRGNNTTNIPVIQLYHKSSLQIQEPQNTPHIQKKSLTCTKPLTYNPLRHNCHHRSGRSLCHSPRGPGRYHGTRKYKCILYQKGSLSSLSKTIYHTSNPNSNIFIIIILIS